MSVSPGIPEARREAWISGFWFSGLGKRIHLSFFVTSCQVCGILFQQS